MCVQGSTFQSSLCSLRVKTPGSGSKVPKFLSCLPLFVHILLSDSTEHSSLSGSIAWALGHWCQHHYDVIATISLTHFPDAVGYTISLCLLV